MTVNRGLWVPIVAPNIGTTELEARLADAALFESNNGADPRSGLLGVQTPNVVTGKTNMSYDIAACNPVINRVAGEGVYRFSATGVTNVPTDPAPGANSRIDIIYVKQNDASKGDANNLAIAGVAKGVVAAIPAAPAIPTGALELARATVGANITGTTSAAITQTFRHTALKGTPIPVRNTTERAEITSPRAGQMVERLDQGGRPIDVWSGTAWAGAEKPMGHAGVTAGFIGGGSPTNIESQFLRGGMTFSGAEDALVIPVTGYYRLSCKMYTSGGSGGNVSCNILVNGVNSGCGISWNKVQVDEYKGATMVKLLNAGDKVTLQTSSPASVYGADGYNGTWIEAIMESRS